MSIIEVSATEANQMQLKKALIVDIRSPQEYLREHITHAINIPIEDLGNTTQLPKSENIIFYCKAGNRTKTNIHIFEKTFTQAYLLKGGIDAWKTNHLPTTQDKNQPIDIQRQVQITTGLLILIGLLLGYTISTWFFLISTGIGIGLVFAGISGYCGLAKVLMKAPWNTKYISIKN
ncbi:rhodanese-like domain-containing protein [Acinetobacter nectaris]|uniref:rhodanese-like domain-containing protein n=1 Tax=Acinetobacter nectaris TaxID=1219382 RepID=UPI001F3C1F9D|nr:rhodanese-like domain-containing protein [Acinetobacter nectaris]MCF8998387.1 DUF2892 domain-containing protein [Acinetobacter nectaris]MCF9028418.1 DUF2892 domain-containing protein [Acinetobacter nectaris]